MAALLHAAALLVMLTGTVSDGIADMQSWQP